MYAGGKSGGIYPTDTPASAGYKVVHSGGAVVAVEKEKEFDSLVTALNERGDCKRLKAFVAWSYDPPAGETVEIKGCGTVPFLSWQSLKTTGTAEDDTELMSRVDASKPGHCAALIYTSGTTGDPKAVMVSHDNLAYVANTIFGTLASSCGFANAAEEERILSYLPLSHVAGLCMDLIGQLAVGALTKAHTVVFFARVYDLKASTIKDRLGIARPTAFLGVPLVWEKMADRIRSIGAASTGLKKTLGDWSKAKALVHAKNIRLGGDGSAPFNHCLAMKVLGAVKSQVGLDKCKYALTGAAPIRVDTLE